MSREQVPGAARAPGTCLVKQAGDRWLVQQLRSGLLVCEQDDVMLTPRDAVEEHRVGTRVLAVGDSYVSVHCFKDAFVALARGHAVEGAR